MVKVIGAQTLDRALSALQDEAFAGEERGERTLIFCEDRLTLLAERAILQRLGGSFLCSVTTFARFLKGEERVLSKHGSVIAISALLAEHKEELHCFGERAAQTVYETIAQLAASRVTPQMLRESAEEVEGVLSFKLRDLALIFECYREFLSAHGLLDESGYLALLPSRIEETLGGTNIIFFAFRSFTRQALEGVRAAMRTGACTTGIFLAGKECFYTNEAAAAFRRVADEQGASQNVFLTDTLPYDAERMRSALFCHDCGLSPAASGQVYSFRAADGTDEMNTVAALIKRKIAEGKRFRDIAVLIGDESYLLPLLKAFEAYKIPFYADRKRTCAEHPFSRFVLAVLAAVSGGPAPDEAEEVAASVYFGDTGVYRNYLAKFGGYRGAARRPVKEEALPNEREREAVLSMREKMVAILDLFKREDRACAYTQGIGALWELVGGEKITAELAAALPEEEAFLDITRFFQVLRETETIAGEKRYTARAFAALLQSGLEAMKISMLPRRADTVFVGDITAGNICRTPVLFCVGLSDGLPLITEDTAVITDGEIERLSALKVEIEPAIAVVNARAREALALSLLSFSEELYLSYPARKGDGEAMPSEIFSYLNAAIVPRPIPPLFPYDCTEYAPALLAYFSACDAQSAGKVGEKDAGHYLALKEVFERGTFGHGTREDVDALKFSTHKENVSEAAELYFSGEISPTLLEDYFTCPYKSFAERALRLREREERGIIEPADAGAFVHTVLQRLAPALNAFESEEACAGQARACAEALLSEPKFRSLSDTAAGEYTARALIREASTVACASYRQLMGSRYRVKCAEAEIRIPELNLCGRADRVDEADGLCRVIDYKTGGFDDSPTAYYTGQRLQLELYLLASAEGRSAAGAFYFPAADDFTKEEERAGKFRMKGFYCSDPEAVSAMDASGAERSEFFEGGPRSQKGLPREEFDAFLHYSILVSKKAEEEMRGGHVRPSPYGNACAYCKFKGMCAFSGTPRSETAIKAGEIASIAKEETK